MSVPPEYQAIPSAQVQNHHPSLFAHRSWYETLRSRLPRHPSLRAIFLLSAAVVAVLLVVSSPTRASTHSRSIVWARFTTNPVTRTRSVKLAPRPYRPAGRPYLPFLHDKWIHRGRCYLKCRKAGSHEVCCKKSDHYTERRNACICDCLGGHVTTHKHCECDCDNRGPSVCCSTSKGLVEKNSACVCDCVAGGTVLSKGSCPVVPETNTPQESPKQSPACVCDLSFDQVCCQSDSDNQTAMEINECICECKPGKVVPTANCYPPSPSPTPKPLALAQSTETPVCTCDLDFNAVCCNSGGENTMEINACICKCKPNGMVVPETNCGAPTPTPEEKGCVCPLVFAPVCCKTAKGSVREVNECVCACKDGGEVVSDGYCA